MGAYTNNGMESIGHFVNIETARIWFIYWRQKL